MKKAFIAEGALNLALACITGTGDAEKAEPVACNHCLGTGQMVRDPDIGTDQECFVCDGSGFVTEDPRTALEEAESAEPVAEVVALGQYEFPHLQWLSADHSLRVPCGTKLYTEQQLNELICQLSTAKSLSVTNIIINVVPGEDGMGEEVYAKSVEDVERLIASLSELTEASLDAERTWETMMMKAIGEDGPGSVATAIGLLKQQRDELVADAERYRWLRDRNNPLEKYDFNNQVDNGKSCYHVVGEVRELKHGDELDAAIDAAIATLAKVGAGNTQHPVSTD